MPRRLFAATAALSLLGACAASRTPARLLDVSPDTPPAQGRTYLWTFDDVPATPGSGVIRRDARVFESLLGRWGAAPDPLAPSAPNVYRQSGSYGARERTRVVVSGLAFSDQTVRVKCRPESGANAGCGVLLFVADGDRYLLARADAKTDRFSVVSVDDGVQRELASGPARVTTGAWHTLAVGAHGGHIAVDWDDARILDVDDDTTREAGGVGLSTAGDAVTSFDDFEVTSG